MQGASTCSHGAHGTERQRTHPARRRAAYAQQPGADAAVGAKVAARAADPTAGACKPAATQTSHPQMDMAGTLSLFLAGHLAESRHIPPCAC